MRRSHATVAQHVEALKLEATVSISLQVVLSGFARNSSGSRETAIPAQYAAACAAAYAEFHL